MPWLVACTPPPVAPEQPFRDAWSTEAEIEFLHADADGLVLISTLSIGGVGGENFANRGDVIVNFDGPADTMIVELRRFAQASTEHSAFDQMAELGLWAYEGAVVQPEDKSNDDSCLDSWSAACELRVFQRRYTQREVMGADIRVTLPAGFRGELDIVTEDDDAGPDYFNRADVCVDGLTGSATINLNSGQAWVRVSDDINPTPTCPPQDVAACETWTTPDADGQPVSTPWAPGCPCLAGSHLYGGVVVDSTNFDYTDATVDVPGTLWTALDLENRLSGRLDRECEAIVDLPADRLMLDTRDSDAAVRGDNNFPGVPATGGAGYRVNLESGDCGPVAFSTGPQDPRRIDGEQASERRGFLEVCDGCIEQSCNALVP